MKLLNLFGQRRSASVARDRLQILLAYERASKSSSDLLIVLREEILAVVGRHVSIDPERIDIRMEPGDKVSVLEVNMEIPNRQAGQPALQTASN
jgi:cell division topological specificity factor